VQGSPSDEKFAYEGFEWSVRMVEGFKDLWSANVNVLDDDLVSYSMQRQQEQRERQIIQHRRQQDQARQGHPSTSSTRSSSVSSTRSRSASSSISSIGMLAQYVKGTVSLANAQLRNVDQQEGNEDSSSHSTFVVDDTGEDDWGLVDHVENAPRHITSAADTQIEDKAKLGMASEGPSSTSDLWQQQQELDSFIRARGKTDHVIKEATCFGAGAKWIGFGAKPSKTQVSSSKLVAAMSDHADRISTAKSDQYELKYLSSSSTTAAASSSGKQPGGFPVDSAQESVPSGNNGTSGYVSLDNVGRNPTSPGAGVSCESPMTSDLLFHSSFARSSVGSRHPRIQFFNSLSTLSSICPRAPTTLESCRSRDDIVGGRLDAVNGAGTFWKIPAPRMRIVLMVVGTRFY
jgi:hypothetical protein